VVSFPLAFPQIIYTRSSFPLIRATCPAHLILLNSNIPIILGEEYKSRSSALCSFLYSPITSTLIPHLLLSPLFSNTLSLCSSHNVRDQFSVYKKLKIPLITVCSVSTAFCILCRHRVIQILRHHEKVIIFCIQLNQNLHAGNLPAYTDYIFLTADYSWYNMSLSSVFTGSNTKVYGFESQPRHGCLCTCIRFVLSCMKVEALRRG
jgi:hypothetical protein